MEYISGYNEDTYNQGAIFGNHYTWGIQRDNFHVSPDYFNQTYWPFPFLAKWLLRTQRLRTTKGKDHQVLITIVWRNFESHSYLQIQLELSLTQIFFSSSIINWSLGRQGHWERWGWQGGGGGRLQGWLRVKCIVGNLIFLDEIAFCSIKMSTTNLKGWMLSYCQKLWPSDGSGCDGRGVGSCKIKHAPAV